MLLEFQVENFLSFKEIAKLSMISSSAISANRLNDSIVTLNKTNILTSAAIFGANASGKSNLIKAIGFMKKFITESAKESTFGQDIDLDNFALSEETINEPSTFEITFIVPNNNKLLSTNDNIIFRYGFQISKKKVEAEWLFARFTTLESKLFIRDNNEIINGDKFKEGKQIYNTLGDINDTTLFLSLIANIKGKNAPITGLIMEWFTGLTDITSIADNNFLGVTASLMEMPNTNLKQYILTALKYADMSIEDIVPQNIDDNNDEYTNHILNEIKDDTFKNLFSDFSTYHNVYNSDNEKTNITKFDFKKQESDGTKKYFALIGAIILSLFTGTIIVIDEMDARLHPNLFLVLVSLFNSRKTNKRNAQLIFATHNTLVMNKRYLRRDQIYLTKKNKYGASELYSLLDYKSVRNDATFNKDYLLGKYDAVPYLGNFESIFNKD